MPAGHKLQTEALSEEYLKVSQTLQVADPAKENVHVRQGEHGPPSGPLSSAVHFHAVTDVDPGIDVLLSGHSVQLSDPMLSEYLPAPQSVHTAVPMTAGPAYPKLQRQALIAVCPVSECPEFAGQAAQVTVEADVGAVAPEYVFKPQSVHTAVQATLVLSPHTVKHSSLSPPQCIQRRNSDRFPVLVHVAPSRETARRGAGGGVGVWNVMTSGI